VKIQLAAARDARKLAPLSLIYTAVTRGKQLVIVVGSKKALAMAIRNDKTQKRYTRPCGRLRQYR
jgi:exodeoxyribonuclease V alpha subunit